MPKFASQNAIRTIAIDNNISIPNRIIFVGTIVTSLQYPYYLQQVAKNNHIYIDKIVRDQFIQQIKNNGTLKLVNNKASADVLLKIDVEEYGFMVLTPYTLYYSPLLQIIVFFIKQNKVIWKDAAYVWAIGLPKYEISEIEKNPSLIYQAWNAAAEKAVGKIMKKNSN